MSYRHNSCGDNAAARDVQSVARIGSTAVELQRSAATIQNCTRQIQCKSHACSHAAQLQHNQQQIQQTIYWLLTQHYSSGGTMSVQSRCLGVKQCNLAVQSGYLAMSQKVLWLWANSNQQCRPTAACCNIACLTHELAQLST
jgi:hypothetical protein